MDNGLVKVVVPPGGSPMGTRVYAADGVEVKGITSVAIDLQPSGPVTATIGLTLSSGLEVEAHPLLTEETLRAAAAALGYDLVKNGDGSHEADPETGGLGWFNLDEDGRAWIGRVMLSNGRVHWSGPYMPFPDVEATPTGEEQAHSEG